MTPPATAAAARTAPERRPQRRPARPQRRMSGPAAAAPRASAGSVALPLRVLDAPFARALRVRTSGVLDALLAGRGWIALIGLLLVGIVFFNVDLLRMNREIALTAEKNTALKRENARLRQEAAVLGTSERIRDAAARLGLVLPGAGDVRYLKAHPAFDARKAARSIVEPSEVTAFPVATAPDTSTSTTTAPIGADTTTDPAAATPMTDSAATDPTTTTTTGETVTPAPTSAEPTATAEGGAVAPDTATASP